MFNGLFYSTRSLPSGGWVFVAKASFESEGLCQAKQDIERFHSP